MGGSLRCLFLIMLVFFANNASAKGARKSYIVMLDSKLCTNKHATNSAINRVLGKVLEGSTLTESVIYRYYLSCGFAASLTSKEVKKLSRFHEIASIEPEQIYHIDDSIVRPHGVHHIIDRSRLETEAPLASNVNNHRIRILP
ncbi:hypothetical protein RGQ29_029116 [Quercus rubra]|uniref:Inhibitor I9 domain-containing protein n=1 Tax=Quercus rubra TaxID=3512 RepID=A0AAN7EUT7_QUERU|nr:hypothetical protein RGQ29_029116 [Quercus rubra]